MGTPTNPSNKKEDDEVLCATRDRFRHAAEVVGRVPSGGLPALMLAGPVSRRFLFMILLTGATGYIEGRLLTRLESAGYRVRCVCRNPEQLLPRVSDETEVVRSDLRDPESPGNGDGWRTNSVLLGALNGCGGEFQNEEKAAAENFARTAAAAPTVERIVYLGGLAHDDDLSPHLRSRVETGEILRTSGVSRH